MDVLPLVSTLLTDKDNTRAFAASHVISITCDFMMRPFRARKVSQKGGTVGAFAIPSSQWLPRSCRSPWPSNREGLRTLLEVCYTQQGSYRMRAN